MHVLLFIEAVFYVVFAAIIIWKLTRWAKTPKSQLTTFLLSVFIAVLIPTWNIPILNWEFEQLCKFEAGNHVCEEVFLGPEY